MNRTALTQLSALLLALLALILAGCQQPESQKQPPPKQQAATQQEPAKRPFEGRTLTLFVGSASQPPTELAAQTFMEKTGAKLELQFGGSGDMLSRMKLSGRGDIFFPGSSDYIEIAKREKLVDPTTETIIAYLVPAINVPKGNPAGIRTLEDLARPGLRIGIARPDTVCVGLYAVEVLERAGLAEKVRPNIVTHAESCAKTAQIVALGQVDAVIGWDVFQYWDPDKIETVLLKPDEVSRIGFLPAAIGVDSKDRELARAFLAYLTSPDGQAIYRRWNYLTTPEDARKFARPDTPVGGEWPLPKGW